ncbi:hypothetical protein [Algoriphagus boritolerans]|uniref:Uncharacterized protein n=1 Tax=Algoriphagus boritolerans DSM 17298 = JCM 18970 TaxID=1120964 RepID=A0A1H5XX86_9BACT|nr:hypothetical protein [Algoriphagus boritolerans]SEG15896.1 hypothetical protein SAMN03080598_02713 [Algoriphagus boritolerans DSM 17298 = JCM 18970]
MSGTVLLLSIMGATVSLLLSVIAYFLKFLVQDFRKLQLDFLEIKSRQESMRGEIDRISEVLLLLKKQLIKKVKWEQ